MKLKNLKNLNVLGKKEQKAINGGITWYQFNPPKLCLNDLDCFLGGVIVTACIRFHPGAIYGNCFYTF